MTIRSARGDTETKRPNGKANRREYCMIFRGPGFLVVVWFGSSPSPVRKLDRGDDTQEYCSRETTCWRERGRGAKSYGGEKARSSINHSIYSGKSSIKDTKYRVFVSDDRSLKGWGYLGREYRFMCDNRFTGILRVLHSLGLAYHKLTTL